MKYKIAKSKIDSTAEVNFDIQRFEGTSEADNLINSDNNVTIR